MFMFPRDRMRRWASLASVPSAPLCSGNKRKRREGRRGGWLAARAAALLALAGCAIGSRAFVTDSACSKSRRAALCCPQAPRHHRKDRRQRAHGHGDPGPESGRCPSPSRPLPAGRSLRGRPDRRGDPLRRSHYPPRQAPPRAGLTRPRPSASRTPSRAKSVTFWAPGLSRTATCTLTRPSPLAP